MSETKTLHRNFWVWEFEKEERWLNEMAQEGWALQNAGFCTYTFEKTEPGQYIIRLAMLDSSPDFESFMEELEAQSVGHCFSWGYFRRSAQLGPFDMFSDVDSRISHLNKIGQMVRLLCLANLLIGVTNIFSGASLAHDFSVSFISFKTFLHCAKTLASKEIFRYNKITKQR